MSQPSEHPTRHLSSFHLEALRAGVASPEERRFAEAHGATCARCAALVEQLDGFRQEWATRALPRTRAAVRQGVSQGRRSRLWVWAAGALAPLAIAGLVLVLGRTSPGDLDPSIREKGGPVLSLVARRGEHTFAVRAGDRVQPGDQLRFVLKGVTLPFGMIASVDGAGQANIYVPYDGEASAPLTAGDRLELPDSIVLDGRLGPERVFALFSRTPLAAAAVRQALTELGARGPAAIRTTPTLPVATDAQSSVLVEKVSP